MGVSPDLVERAVSAKEHAVFIRSTGHDFGYEYVYGCSCGWGGFSAYGDMQPVLAEMAAHLENVGSESWPVKEQRMLRDALKEQS